MSRHLICALGNSHLAAAKLGWDAISSDYPEFEFDFFGFPPGTSTSFSSDVSVEGKYLVPLSERLRSGFELTSGGRSRIDARAYHAFAIFGLGLGGPNNPARVICSNYRLAQHATGESFLISEACLAAAIDGLMRSPRALAPIRTIRLVSNAPVFWQSTPVPTVRITEHPSYANDPLSDARIVSMVKRIYDVKAGEIGTEERFYYLRQPEVTLDDSGLTKDEYIANGVSFTGRAKKTNISHGNQEYGALIMRQLLAHLRQPAKSRLESATSS